MMRARLEQRTFLERVLERASERGPRDHALVVFDLDSTLYDNRPRTLRILREWGRENRERRPGVASRVLAITPEQQVYRVDSTLRRAGVEDEGVHLEVMTYWRQRFFTDEYCQNDVPTHGALEYTRELHARGLFVVYLTGRDVPGMLVGTVSSLRRDGFPIGVAGTILLMKPDFATPDSAFKADVLDHVRAIGEPVAAFDNEPENCNLFADRWPGCLVALVGTNRSSDAPPLRDDVSTLHDFVR